MSIPEEFHFDKSGEVVRFPRIRAYFLTILVLLVALLAFGIGRLTGGERGGVTINTSSNDKGQMTNEVINPKSQLATPESSLDISHSTLSIPAPTQGSVYASSKGTKYYYASCKSTVSEANKVTFSSPSEAEAAGYTLAANCHQ